MEYVNKIIQGDCIEVLKSLPDKCVHTCVTSPPYFGLRDYGTADWQGGDPECPHVRQTKKSDKTITGHKNFDEMNGVGDAIQKLTCSYCGAVRVDRQIGLEETPDQFVQKLVEVFREVRRVLRDDGTVWLNLGDSYAMSTRGKGGDGMQTGNKGSHLQNRRAQIPLNLKPKDLIGIPWRVAFELQADGWYLRQDIIWHKPNPMPESVTDRCTKAHEYIFLLSKSQRYYFDHEAIAEESTTFENRPAGVVRNREYNYDSKENNNPEAYRKNTKVNIYDNGVTETTIGLNLKSQLEKNKETRNKRSVWTVTTKPYTGAHFATFPQDLIVDCIKAGCPKNGLVLDPFMGAGTTAIVSRKLNRNYVGSELNADYIAIAEKRITSELGMFA